MNWQLIAEQIILATDEPFSILKAEPVVGGDINNCYRIFSHNAIYFIKLNKAEFLPMFEAEFLGLQEIGQTKTVKVPSPIASGVIQTHSFLVMEHLELIPVNASSYRVLGEQLAMLHEKEQSYFGWSKNNTIGTTPQINTKSNDWLSFWHEQRIGYQLNLAAQKGYLGKIQALGQKLISKLNVLFSNHYPKPSLLHGDLWGGNVSADKQGTPVIYDPACYYGDREADIAMTELFGGFSGDFYSAYSAVYPLSQDYQIRKLLYNLYHLLNHLNLFGGSYLRQSENTINLLLSELS